MVVFTFPSVQVSTAGLATEAEQILQTAELVDINTELNTQTTALGDVNTELNTQTTELQDINTELNTITGHVDGIETLITSTNTKLDSIIANSDILATFQTSTLVDASSTNIPGNASLPLTLIASTSAITRKIQVIEDIGEYMALYTGAASSEVLLAALPLGGGEIEVNVPAATRISIKALKTPAITSSNLIVNLLG
jgi:hypothetical protein